jgi:peptide/nickel transport system permease protein
MEIASDSTKIILFVVSITGCSSIGAYHVSGFWRSGRLIVGQTGDKKTMDNIRRDFYLINQNGNSFLHLNDVSPIGIHKS